MRLFIILMGLAGSVTLSRAGCGGRWNCIAGMATCSGAGHCVCDEDYVKGHGNFMCYKDNYYAAEVKNDPVLSSFANESRHFPFPCRYLVTHVRQKLKDGDSNKIGECELEIYAFNAKSSKGGSFFVHGFDVAGQLEYDSGYTYTFSSRIYGTATNGEYSFTKLGTVGQYLPDGPWGTDDVTYTDDTNEVKLKITEESDNNQIQFKLKKCGLVVSFVPYELEEPDLMSSIPGISVSISSNRNIEFYDNDLVMALAPSEVGGPKYSDIIPFDGLNEEESLLTRAFTNEYTQNQPNDDNEMCRKVGQVLGNCANDEMIDGYANCLWMLKEPRFIRCYDNSDGAKDILKLFKKCLNMFCGDNTCDEIQQKIIDSGCDTDVTGVSALTNFMNGYNCP